jgi:hypothetical protein
LSKVVPCFVAEDGDAEEDGDMNGAEHQQSHSAEDDEAGAAPKRTPRQGRATADAIDSIQRLRSQSLPLESPSKRLDALAGVYQADACHSLGSSVACQPKPGIPC